MRPLTCPLLRQVVCLLLLLHTSLASFYNPTYSPSSHAQYNPLTRLTQLHEEKLLLEIEVKLKTDPRVRMTVPQLVQHYGYGAEVHTVVTDDGYILQLHRVLAKGNRACNLQGKRCPPVLLQHGLLGSSSAWVMNEPKIALAYVLADEGYDVWMGNARGNIYSLNHTSLDIEDWDFWNFSFDEMGKHDLPAVIDFILKYTKHNKLHYVGHSMGTTMFWVLMNERPEYSSKVSSMTALGPVAFVNNIESPIKRIGPYTEPLRVVLLDIVRHYRILDPEYIVTKLVEEACSEYRFSRVICSDLIFILIGFDSNDLNLDWLPVILGQLNGGASTRTLIHFGQLMQSGQFLRYDFGEYSNMDYYNQTSPPPYSLNNITVPVLLKWGPNDWLADPQDVQHLISQFNKTHLEASPVSNPNFNHLDFLWGRDAKVTVYDQLIAFIKKHGV